MKLWKPTIAVLAGGFLAACATDVDRVQTVQPTDGTEFTRALTDEYRELSLRQGRELNVWSNAYHSADKGLRAADGENVMPDIPVEHGFPKNERCIMDEDMRAELADARERLLGLMDENARQEYPLHAARAQGRYDCWIAEVEFRQNEDVIAECRGDFMTLVADLEDRMRPEPEPEPAPEPEPEPVQPMEYTVYFDHDDATVRADQMDKIEEAAQLARDDAEVRVTVVGHTDRAGADDYNLRLSMRRADNVRDALVDRGVDSGQIAVDGRGEAEPAVPTADGVSEQANRRVEILVQ